MDLSVRADDDNAEESMEISITEVKSKLKNSVPLVAGLPYRMIFAVATEEPYDVQLYDTQMFRPFATLSGLHLMDITDLAWSSDGRVLLITSGDGYLSYVEFDEAELGQEFKVPVCPVEASGSHGG